MLPVIHESIPLHDHYCWLLHHSWRAGEGDVSAVHVSPAKDNDGGDRDKLNPGEGSRESKPKGSGEGKPLRLSKLLTDRAVGSRTEVMRTAAVVWTAIVLAIIVHAILLPFPRGVGLSDLSGAGVCSQVRFCTQGV